MDIDPDTGSATSRSPSGQRGGLEEQTLQELMQAAQEGVIVHDGTTILRANEPAARLFGYQPEEIIGKPALSLVAPPSHDAVRERLATGLEGTYEALGQHKDGRAIRLRVAAQSLLVAGKRLRVAYLQPMPEDIVRPGEFKLSSAEIRKLVEADQLKTRILNVAAHELNTPITPLRLQLHLLLSGAMGNLEARQRHALEIVDRNVNRLSNLVSEILDVSRLQAGRMRISAEALDAAAVIGEAVESYAEAARRVGVSLGVEVTPGLAILADRERVEQVLFNLISNALKFTPADGHVYIIAQPRGPHGEVMVRDSGIGMTNAQISRLFQPFSQVHDLAQMDVPGTGLGLFICRGIVEAMGGRIEASSDGPHRGSTFRFTLPLATMPLKPAKETEVIVTLDPKQALAKRLRELI